MTGVAEEVRTVLGMAATDEEEEGRTRVGEAEEREGVVAVAVVAVAVPLCGVEDIGRFLLRATRTCRSS